MEMDQQQQQQQEPEVAGVTPEVAEEQQPAEEPQQQDVTGGGAPQDAPAAGEEAGQTGEASDVPVAVEAQEEVQGGAEEEEPLDGDGRAVAAAAVVMPPPPAAAVVDEGRGSQVVHEFAGHRFTQTDLDDVIKIQARFRQQQAKLEAEQRRQDLLAQQAKIVELPPITMPDDSEDGRIPDAHIGPGAVALAAAQEARRHASALELPPGGKRRGATGGVFATVDPRAAKLHVSPMSADTKGMQGVYTRMLKTKQWW